MLIRPGELLLGITLEHVHLPADAAIAARVEGRSTLARMGRAVHLTAPTIHASFRGNIALEMTNHGPLPIRLRPGLLRVCQLILERTGGVPDAGLDSEFQDQTSLVR